MREADIKNFIAKENAPYIPKGGASAAAAAKKNKSSSHGKLPVLGKRLNGRRDKMRYTPVGIDAEKITESASLRKVLMMGESASAVASAVDDPEGEMVRGIDAKNILPRAVGQMIRSLTPREQVILRFYFYEEMSFMQIGKLIGLSGGRVGQLMQRACRKLRETQPAQNLFPVLFS